MASVAVTQHKVSLKKSQFDMSRSKIKSLVKEEEFAWAVPISPAFGAFLRLAATNYK